jgi:hypothetical protein
MCRPVPAAGKHAGEAPETLKQLLGQGANISPGDGEAEQQLQEFGIAECRPRFGKETLPQALAVSVGDKGPSGRRLVESIDRNRHHCHRLSRLSIPIGKRQASIPTCWAAGNRDRRADEQRREPRASLGGMN